MADLYYNDQKKLVATSIAQLLIYFQSIEGVQTAANVVYTLPCPMSAIIRITGGGNLPKFIYKNGLTPANKIYLQALPISPQNLNPLCNGTTFTNAVPPPVIGVVLPNTIGLIVQESGLAIEYYQTEALNPLIQE